MCGLCTPCAESRPALRDYAWERFPFLAEVPPVKSSSAGAFTGRGLALSLLRLCTGNGFRESPPVCFWCLLCSLNVQLVQQQLLSLVKLPLTHPVHWLSRAFKNLLKSGRKKKKDMKSRLKRWHHFWSTTKNLSSKHRTGEEVAFRQI